jgi:hypothetical protein
MHSLHENDPILAGDFSTDELVRRELIPICVIGDITRCLSGRGSAARRPRTNFRKFCRCAKLSQRRIGRGSRDAFAGRC